MVYRAPCGALRYDLTLMRPALLTLALCGMLAAASPASASRAELARAREAYNAGRLDEAVAAAETAAADPATAEAARVVLARALLDRYRQAPGDDGLDRARALLGAVAAHALDADDRTDYLLGVGVALYLDGAFAAAAELFDQAAAAAPAARPQAREAALDWYGAAAERLAAGQPPAVRVRSVAPVVVRMREALARTPGSPAATYWLAAALRAQGLADEAWGAAAAGWARARLSGAAAGDLRADLDRLMREGILPDRVRDLPERDRPSADAALRAEWEQFTARWREGG